MSSDDGNEIDWSALDRYVAGEGSPEERGQMRRRVQASPVLAAIVSAMRSSRSASPESAGDPPNAAAAWLALAAELGFNDAVESTRATARHENRRAVLTLMPNPTRDRGVVRAVVGLAAAALLIAAGGALVTWEARQARRSSEATPAIRAVYATARGERATVELRDGTRVTLAPETELRVAAIGRQVYLSGEAIFSVTHDPTRPFRVITPNGITVQDIGTQFDMRAYAADKTVRVVVADGSVSLHASAQRVTLVRGALGIVDSTGTAQVRQGVAVDQYLGWSQGHLTFTNARMADVVPELRRWFDVEVNLSPNLADDRLTVTLNDVPVDAALDVIARALDGYVVRTGQSVTLYPRSPRESARE
jgi:transmembrane sensor